MHRSLVLLEPMAPAAAKLPADSVTSHPATNGLRGWMRRTFSYPQMQTTRKAEPCSRFPANFHHQSSRRRPKSNEDDVATLLAANPPISSLADTDSGPHHRVKPQSALVLTVV